MEIIQGIIDFFNNIYVIFALLLAKIIFIVKILSKDNDEF